MVIMVAMVIIVAMVMVIMVIIVVMVVRTGPYLIFVTNATNIFV